MHHTLFVPASIPRSTPPPYRKFWKLWRAGEFFACHEVLEELWRATRGRQRLFYNGLINCAVALYQQSRGNIEGAARQLVRAQVKLEPFRPRRDGVEIDRLLNSLQVTLADSLSKLNDKQQARLEALRALVKQKIERDLQEP